MAAASAVKTAKVVLTASAIPLRFVMIDYLQLLNCAAASSDQDGRTCCETCNHHRQHMHQLTAHRHGCDRRRPIELSDDEQVRHTVKRLQKAGNQVRD